MFFPIINSLLLSASIIKILSDFILKFNYLEKMTDIPPGKIIDLVNLPAFLILALIFVTIFKILDKKTDKNPSQKNLIGLAFLISYIAINLQAYFVSYSTKYLLIMVAVVYFIQILLAIFQVNKSVFKYNSRLLLNGMLLGFALMLLFSNFIKLVAVPLTIVFTIPLFYLAFGQKFLRWLESPLHLLLMFSILISTKSVWLLMLIFAIAVLIILTPKLFNKFKLNIGITNYLYITAVVVILTYNPLFYIGHFDSVEEGFWLSWIERLRQHQALYRDVFVFHPPAIIKGGHIFMNIVGVSIYNLRLYLQILQVAGYLFTFLIINHLLKNRWNKLLTFVVILILTGTLVRNNTVFRVGSGLISFLPLFIFFKSGNNKLLTFSGILSVISFLISPEVGLSVLLTLTVVVLITFFGQKKKDWRLISYPLLGIAVGFLPFIVELMINKSINQFIDQIYFYSTSFSGVYKDAIQRPEKDSMFLWIVMDKYLNSLNLFWELAKYSIAAGLLVVYYKLGRSKLNDLTKSTAVLALFALVLIVSFLGRSDYYHLLFALIPVMIVSVYLLENLSISFKHLDKLFLLFLIFYVLRGVNSHFFIQENLNKLQSYANPLGNYQKLDLERGGIYLPDAVYASTIKNLVKYIEDNVQPGEKIFVYPWSPEIYFLAKRQNATSFDTPLVWFSDKHQTQMVNQLLSEKPKYIIYNPKIAFLNLSVESLPLVNGFILSHYQEKTDFGDYAILVQQ